MRSSFWWAAVGTLCALLTVNVLGERGIMIALLAGQIGGLLYLLLVRRGFDLPGTDTRDTYLQWPCAGRMRLLLPLANRRVLRGALSMYSPTRWTGKLYQQLLATALPMLARSGFGHTLQGAQGWCVHMPCLAQMVPGARGEWVGCLQATAGPRAKMTLRLMDEHGHALAYGRVAHAAAEVQIVANEALVLAAVATTDVCTQAPRLIDYGPLTKPDGYFLLESAGAEKAAATALDERHFNFLQGLVRKECMRTWRALLEQMADKLQPVRTSSELAREALARLQRIQLPAMPECIEHGDFAPWNIREQASGELFVLDWEHADLHGVPWLDALHFCFQVETLVRRQPVGIVVARMKTVFVMPSSRRYEAGLPPAADAAYPLMLVYLLRTLASGIREGRSWDAVDQTTRLQVMRRLLREKTFEG